MIFHSQCIGVSSSGTKTGKPVVGHALVLRENHNIEQFARFRDPMFTSSFWERVTGDSPTL